jgi:nitrous oxidase accessory protein NosD
MMRQFGRLGSEAKMCPKLKIFALLTVCMVLLPQGLFAQTTVHMKPGDDLGAALVSANPGTVFELAGGDYGSFGAKRVIGAAELPIILRSADPAHPARISDMDLRQVNHVVLDGLLFDYTYDPADKSNVRSFQIFASRDVIIRNSTFDGDLAPADSPEEQAYPTGFGLSIVSSSDIKVEYNDIYDFYRGLIVSDSVDVNIINNDIHAIRMDGMNFAQVERVLIEGNVIHDFKRAADSADHADMIQFWTNKTDRPSEDITIRNNVLNSGLGWFTQSIFMRNEEVDQSRAGHEMFYRNVKIEGNVIVNAHLHGITVGQTDGLIISQNTILHNSRSDGHKPNSRLWTPQVRVNRESRNVRIQNNVLHAITGYEDQSDWIVANNVEVQDKTDKQPNFYNALFVAAQSGDPRDLGSFRYLASGPLADAGVGAMMLEPGGTLLIAPSQKGPRAPIIRTIPDPDVPNRFIFDITKSSKDLGLDFPEQDAFWDFGDGMSATGLLVSHDYALPGSVEVKLMIKMPGGQILDGTAFVKPRNPEVVVFDESAGIISSYANDPPIKLDLPLRPGPIPLGGDYQLITIPREAIAPFFGSRSFVLQTRIRSSGGYKAAGTLFHIHKTLLVSVGGRGNVSVQFNTETASEIKLSTPPLKVLANEWVDISIEYSDAEGLLRLRANGEVVAQDKISGQIRPLEHWGLALGNAFKSEKSFKGEMDRFVLKVGKDAVIDQN